MSYYDERDDDLFEQFSASDYQREAYGDPCPSCRRLRYGGDCGRCFSEDENPEPWEGNDDGQDDTQEDYPGQRITGPDDDIVF